MRTCDQFRNFGMAYAMGNIHKLSEPPRVLGAVQTGFLLHSVKVTGLYFRLKVILSTHFPDNLIILKADS